MSASIQELETQVLSLDAPDRAHILERLIDSFEPTSKAEDAWVREALRRETEVSSGAVELVPGAAAIARVRDRIG